MVFGEVEAGSDGDGFCDTMVVVKAAESIVVESDVKEFRCPGTEV